MANDSTGDVSKVIAPYEWRQSVNEVYLPLEDNRIIPMRPTVMYVCAAKLSTT